MNIRQALVGLAVVIILIVGGAFVWRISGKLAAVGTGAADTLSQSESQKLREELAAIKRGGGGGRDVNPDRNRGPNSPARQPQRRFGPYEQHANERPREMTNTPCFANGRPGFRGVSADGRPGCIHPD